MKANQLLIKITNLMGIVLFLSACGKEPSVTSTKAPAHVSSPTPLLMTITFSGETCRYRGPNQIPFGRLKLNLEVVNGIEGATYSYTILSLQEGKELADLQAWTDPIHPPDFAKQEFLNAPDHAIQYGSRIDKINLAANAAFTENPVYFVCFAAEPKRIIGVFGPIEIVK